MSDFTKTLEMSRQFLRVYHEHGRHEFLKMFETHLDTHIQAVAENHKLLNSRFLTMLSGILSVLFFENIKEMTRSQVSISQEFLIKTNPQEKKASFMHDLNQFLQDFERAGDFQSLTGRVRFYLLTCPLSSFQQMTVASLADRFGCHPVTLTRKFKKAENESLKKVLTEEKLKRAHTWIRTNQNGPIKELAQKLGFSDADYFSSLFKSRFGVLPSQLVPREGPIQIDPP